MSRLLARIMLALLMVPMGAIVYLLLFFVLYEWLLRRNDELCLLLSGVFTGVFIAVWWCLLWLRSVRWARWRLALTLVAGAVAIAIGAGVGLVIAPAEDELAAFLGPPVAIFLWLTGSVFLWRETAAERARRIEPSATGGLVCPHCGYNMTGLREATCPECGARYTIDELVALQPGQEMASLERAVASAA